MKPVCSKHPEQPAHWLCPKCRQPFCSDCVITLDASRIGGRQVVRFCRKCMIAARPIGVTEAVIPFWKRIFTLSQTSPHQKKSIRYPGNSETASDDPLTAAFKRIDELSSENKGDMALDYIRQWIKNDGAMNAEMARRYSDLLIKAGQTDELRKHASILLKFLIAAGDGQRAVTVFDACGDIKTDLNIDSGTLLKIGDMLSAGGRSRDAVKVFSVVTKSCPHSPDAPLAYFKAAQTCHERLMAPDQAKKILEMLIRKYPGHTMLPAFRSYLSRIGK